MEWIGFVLILLLIGLLLFYILQSRTRMKTAIESSDKVTESNNRLAEAVNRLADVIAKK